MFFGKHDRQTKKEMGAVRPKLLLFLCWLVYAGAYLGRYSYNSNINPIMAKFGVDHAEAGLVTTCFFFAYGIGQVVNGLLCRYYNKKYVLSGALICSAVLNLIVFLGIDFSYLKYLWFINGCVQSVLWSSLISVLGENLCEADLKKAVLVMSTTTASGTFLSYGASALFNLFDAFQLSFLLGTVSLIAIALLWFFLYQKAAILAGGNPENFRRKPVALRNAANSAENKEASGNGHKKIEKSLWITVSALAVFAVINNVIKDGLSVWTPSVLKETYGLPDSLSLVLTLVLPLLGIFGATIAIFANKKIKNFVTLSGVFFLASGLITAGIIGFLKLPYWGLTVICFGLVYAFMSGTNNVITSMAPLYMHEKINSGMLAGILDGFCYLGSTISSYGLGELADNLGWKSVFILFLVASCIVAVAAFCLAAFRKSADKKKNHMGKA